MSVLGDNGYSMSYMLEHIKKSETERVTTINPRQELTDYLEAPLRSTGEQAEGWWSVSITDIPRFIIVLY